MGIVLDHHEKYEWDVPESVVLMKRVKSENIKDCEICTEKSAYAGLKWIWDREFQKKDKDFHEEYEF